MEEFGARRRTFILMTNTSLAAITLEDILAEMALIREENLRLRTQIAEERALREQQKAEFDAKEQWYLEQLNLAKRRRFGVSSERSPEQLGLFNEAENESRLRAPEPTAESITGESENATEESKPKKPRKHRLPKTPEGLPVEIIDYWLPTEQQVCPECGNGLHVMSTNVRRELRAVAVKYEMIEHREHVYACRHCEREGIKTPVVTAKAPNPVIPGSIAGPSLIASIMDAKFVEGLPLYRQEQRFARLGFEISRQNIANWVLHGSDVLKPVYELMHERLLKRKVLMADETRVQVLNEPGRKAETPSTMWLYRTGMDEPSIVLFDYQTTRAGKHAKDFLSGFTGYLHVDGYSGYEILQDVTLVGCFSHARRKFEESIKILSKDKQMKATVSLEGLSYCNKLFAIERELKGASAEKRFKERQKLSRPVLDEFKAWLLRYSSLVLPKSLLGQAIAYCLNQWSKLEAFMLDGGLEIDNNRSERSIKPFVVGRKGWLFANTPKGAKASAIVYSIVETAKENGLVPFEYLNYLLKRLPNLGDGDMEELLPWSKSLPAECRTPNYN